MWFGDHHLRSSHQRLFNLCKLKDISVNHALPLLVDIDSNSLLFWRRSLRGWELQSWEMLKEAIGGFSLFNSEDILRWNMDTGQFTIKKCYSILENSTKDDGPWSVIWNLKIPNKVKLFIWKLCHNILPTRVLLAIILKREIQYCLFCHREVETIDHLFWTYPFSMVVWKDFCRWWSICPSTIQSQVFNFRHIMKVSIHSGYKKAWKVSIAALLWSIWKQRNNCIFNNATANVSSISVNSKRWALEWYMSTYSSSENLSKLWFCDPGAAIINQVKSEKLLFLEKVFSKYGTVAFTDGSWHENEEGRSNGGIGGMALNNNMQLVYIFSGPCKSSNAFETEMLALISMGEALETLGYEYLVCVDSQEAEDFFLRSKAGRIDTLQSFGYIHRKCQKFKFMRVAYVKREWNSTADRLAKEGRDRVKLVAGWV